MQLDKASLLKELEKLGFVASYDRGLPLYFTKYSESTGKYWGTVNFLDCCADFGSIHFSWDYADLNWRQELLTKVMGLIDTRTNEDNPK